MRATTAHKIFFNSIPELVLEFQACHQYYCAVVTQCRICCHCVTVVFTMMLLLIKKNKQGCCTCLFWLHSHVAATAITGTEQATVQWCWDASCMPNAKLAGRESVLIICSTNTSHIGTCQYSAQSLQNAGLPLITKQVINAVWVLL